MSSALSADDAPGIFTQAPDRIPLDAIVVLLRENYGIECIALEMLSGERDQNYRVVDRGGTTFVCKVTHPSEPPNVTASQTRVLRHLARIAPDLPVQHIVATRDGHDSLIRSASSIQPTTVRVLTYLHGTPMHQATQSSATRRSLGNCHARLIAALASLDGIDTAPDLLWDLSHIERVEPLLTSIRSEQDRALAQRFLDLYRNHAQPAVGGLRSQLIHNDLNPHNLLVDAQTSNVCGILDFGDLVFAPMLNDIAIAASYLIDVDGDPLDGICDYLAAFNQLVPLLPGEIDALFPLIGGRLVMTVAITEWRSILHPENSKYILRNNPSAWRGLRRLSCLSLEDARIRFRHACQ